MERELCSLGERDCRIEIDRHRRDRKRAEQGKGFEQRLPLGQSGADFLQARVRDFESNEARGAEGRVPQPGDDLFAPQFVEQERDDCGRIDDLIGHGLRG